LPDRLTGGSLAIFMLTFFATLLGEVARPHDLCANLAGRDLSLLKTSSARIHWWFRTHGDSLRSWRSRQTERAFEQEAFASAFRALDKFNGDAMLSTWLHRIVVNAALVQLRSKRRLGEQPIDSLRITLQATES